MKILPALALSLLLVLIPSFALAATNSSGPKCVLPKSDIYYGTQGPDVTYLQEFLKSKSYLSAEPTGYFGSATLEGVKRFQQSQGIDATGYVGVYTRARLRVLTCEGSEVANAPQDVTIVAPESGAEVQAGERMLITWAGTVSGVDQVSLHLISNHWGDMRDVRTLGKTRLSKGNFTWKVPTNLSFAGGPGAGYFIAMRGKAFETTSASFSIIGKESASAKVPPVITGTNGPGLDSYEAYIGKRLVIEGKNFLRGPTDSTVYFAGRKVALAQAAEDDMLQIIVPDVSVGTYSLYVVTSEGKSNVVRVKVQDPNGNTTLDAPKITLAVGKAAADFEGDANVSLSIYGKNFTADSRVYLGGARIYPSQTPDSEGDRIVILVPSIETGSYDLYVVTEGGKSNRVQVWINGKG